MMNAVTEGTLRTTGGRALPLKGTDVRATIAGPIAEVELEQRFVNETVETIEAVYAFPLPHGASVFRMAFHIADRVVRAVVKPKEEARREYEAALHAGRAATLLEEDEPSVFTLSVANVPPGATVRVELAYQELLGFDEGEWRFVFPMVAPERYVEMPEEQLRAIAGVGAQGAAGASLPHVDAVRPPRLASGERAPDVSLEVTLRSREPIEGLCSTSHAIEVSGAERDARVKLRDHEGAIANRDFVLTFRAGGAGVRADTRFERQEGEPGTFLLTFTPPAEPAIPLSEARGGEDELKAIRCGNCGGLVTDLGSIVEIPGLGPAVPCGYCGAVLAPSTARPFTRATRPRDVLVLVDRSASMRASLPAARRAVAALLEALPSGDGVQVIAFDHEREAFDGAGKGYVSSSPEVANKIDAFLAALKPRGGTELEKALERAAALPRREGRTPVIVLVTDAAVGNEGRLVRRSEELLGDARRLYVLGVGPAVDRRLCERLARANGGASDVLGIREDVEVLERFARRVRDAGPILTGLSLAIEGGEVREVCPSAIDDLFAGQPVTVLGRYEGEGPCRFVLTGTSADGRPFRQHVDVELPAVSDEAPGLSRLWAKRRIEALLELADEEPSKAREVKEEVTRLALACSLTTRYTSLVAVDSEVSAKGPARRVEQPSAVEHDASLAVDGAAMEDFEMDEPSRRAAAPGGAAPRSRTMTLAGAIRGAPGEPPPLASAPPPPAPERLAAARSVEASVPPSRPARRVDDSREAKGGVLGAVKRAILGAGTLAAPRIEAPGSEAYSEAELAWLRGRASGELDLVFLVDETGSMGRYIDEVKARLLELVAALRAMPLCRSLRLGIVTYRDHPPQDPSYASRVVPLTDDVEAIEREARTLVASGGGDGPESVTDGLFDVVRLAWRPSAAKAVVWFGDAPPHGVEPHGDGFPQGCPCGNHWYAQAESCREMGVAIYAVGCLPGLRGYAGAEDVFRTVARTTRGIYLPLTAARLLVPLMASAAATELDRRRIDAHVLERVREHEAVLGAVDERERVRWLGDLLKHADVRVREMTYEEGAESVPPLRFRALSPRDVEGALDRLRSAGAIAV